MTPPSDHQPPPDSADLDRTGVLLERYLTAPDKTVLDEELRTFVTERPALVQAVKALRASWQEQLGMPPVAPPSALHPDRAARPLHWRMRSVAIGALAFFPLVLVVLGRLREPVRTTSIGVSHYRTAPGQRLTLRLADGSTALLAPATLATVTDRGIDVTGEVYFTIPRHSARPVVVRTAHAVVRVLGTRFSVRHYAHEARSRVVVEEGRVTLRTFSASAQSFHATVLSEGMAAFASDSGTHVESHVATQDYTGWTQGVLTFHHLMLRDVVAELSRAYGVNIRVTDSTLAERVMSAEVVVAREPLAGVLRDICTILGAQYTQSGREFILSRSGVAPMVPDHRPRHDRVPQLERSYGR